MAKKHTDDRPTQTRSKAAEPDAARKPRSFDDPKVDSVRITIEIPLMRTHDKPPFEPPPTYFIPNRMPMVRLGFAERMMFRELYDGLRAANEELLDGAKINTFGDVLAWLFQRMAIPRLGMPGHRDDKPNN